VARAAPDGLTLMTVDPGLIVVPYMVAKPGFDLQKDFAWIAPLMRSYMTLIVNKDFPVKNVADFVAMARSKPGEIKYGTSGLGTPPYLGALAFIQATGIDLLHVPYRGAALALNDVIGGQISAVWVSQASASAQVKGGLVRVLGVYGNNRLPSLPDVPTFRESGVDTGVADQGTWFGIAAPAATPRDIVDKLNAAVNKALQDPATRALLEKADFVDIKGGTPEQLKTIVDENAAYWKDSFAKAGVRPPE
jgi:tripartite-type tricarboxylate transporter receptor subunit TctC